jgi:flagellar hook protein FlgE
MQTALSGMNAATAMVGVAAHNLANYQTDGFKASRVQLADLPPRLGNRLRSSGIGLAQFGSGVQVVGIQTDSTQGALQVDQPLPLLALEGEGFFILEGRDGRRLYTRNGHFHLSTLGQLATPDGDLVLGFGLDASGDLDTTHLQPLAIALDSQAQFPSGEVAALRRYAIGRSGRITGHYTNGHTRTLGQLRRARFTNPAGLAALPGNKFAATAASGLPLEHDPIESGAAGIVSGATELSNVDLGRELIELTLAGNLFQANVAVFQTADNMLSSLFFPWRAR